MTCIPCLLFFFPLGSRCPRRDMTCPHPHPWPFFRDARVSWCLRHAVLSLTPPQVHTQAKKKKRERESVSQSSRRCIAHPCSYATKSQDPFFAKQSRIAQSASVILGDLNPSKNPPPTPFATFFYSSATLPFCAIKEVEQRCRCMFC